VDNKNIKQEPIGQQEAIWGKAHSNPVLYSVLMGSAQSGFSWEKTLELAVIALSKQSALRLEQLVEHAKNQKSVQIINAGASEEP